MSEQTFPYDGWVLMPSFKPKLVTFTKRYESRLFDAHISSDGKSHLVGRIYATKTAAIEAGFAKTDAMEAMIVKMQLTLNKRLEALLKAKREA